MGGHKRGGRGTRGVGGAQEGWEGHKRGGRGISGVGGT